MEGWTSLFTQDGPPSHFSQKALQCLNETFTDRWIGTGGLILWPPRLLYLTTSIFRVSGLKHTHKKLACIWEATNTFIMWTLSRCVQRHMWSSHLPPLHVLNYSILLHAEVGNSLLQWWVNEIQNPTAHSKTHCDGKILSTFLYNNFIIPISLILQLLSALLITRSVSTDGMQLTSASTRCKGSSTGAASQLCIQPLTLFLESWYGNGAHRPRGNKNAQTEHKLCYGGGKKVILNPLLTTTFWTNVAKSMTKFHKHPSIWEHQILSQFNPLHGRKPSRMAEQYCTSVTFSCPVQVRTEVTIILKYGHHILDTFTQHKQKCV